MAFWQVRTNRLIARLLTRAVDNQRHFDHRLSAIESQIGKIQEGVESIMASNEDIQSEVNDLKNATALIAEGVSTLKANLSVATDKINELESAGVSPDTLASLRAAVDGAQEIAGQFQAAADPDVPTPDPSELPDPVEPTPSDPTPAPEQPSGDEPGSAFDDETPA